jgi:hypothetical protein
MAVSADHGIRRQLYFRAQSMYSLNDLKSLQYCVVKLPTVVVYLKERASNVLSLA